MPCLRIYIPCPAFILDAPLKSENVRSFHGRLKRLLFKHKMPGAIPKEGPQGESVMALLDIFQSVKNGNWKEKTCVIA